MKIIALSDRLAKETDKLVEVNKEKFKSRANFVSEAVIEKLEKESKIEFTFQRFNDLIKKFSKEIGDSVSFMLERIKDEEILPNLMSFFIDAEEVFLVEGKKEIICKAIKEKVSPDKISEAFLFLESPEEKEKLYVFDFLRELDTCIPEKTERHFRLIKNDKQDFAYGRLFLKTKKESEKDAEKKK